MAQALKGSVVVVTGASSGIGRATALEFARRGATVVVAARREALLQEVAEECEAAGGLALAVATDTSDEAAVGELARRAVEAFGKIDVWVNNAGAYLLGRFEDTPPEAYRRVVDTNFFGFVHGARAVLPQFRRQGHGVLINNASVYSHVAAPFVSAYAPSKFAVRALSEALRMELIGTGIHVCTVSPSTVDTPLFHHTANYTGRAVKPAPPAYAPERVALAIVRAARRPRRERVVGTAGRQITLLRNLAPPVFERVNARFVDRQHFSDEPAEPTTGNLFAPVDDAGEVDGGWRGRPRRKAAGRLARVGLLAMLPLALAWRARRAA